MNLIYVQEQNDQSAQKHENPYRLSLFAPDNQFGHILCKHSQVLHSRPPLNEAMLISGKKSLSIIINKIMNNYLAKLHMMEIMRT